MALFLNSHSWVLWTTYGCLEILTGPARAVTTDYGRFACGCSQARKASARARTVPTHAPYGTRRVDIQILMIPKNTDNPYNIRAHPKRVISYGVPKGHRPVRLPKSYGPLIGITRRCGHLQMAVLLVICVFFGQGVERYRT